MVNRTVAALVAVSFLGMQSLPMAAFADNQMGYRLLPASEAAQLPKGGGTLGLNVGPAQRISDSGMSFELLRVNSVNRNSPGEQAGLKAGDQIIAVDGRVFPSVAAFAAYIGSGQPGRSMSFDYMPSGGGPAQAQRVSVVLGGAGRNTPAQPAARTESSGLSTGTKVAIGVGAAALFGCYKLGCFSHRKANGTTNPQPAPN